MNVLKLVFAIAVLAFTACQAASPTGLPQDRGLQQADGTCDPDAMPC